MKKDEIEATLKFRAHVQLTAFSLTLSGNMCRALNEIGMGRGAVTVGVFDTRVVDGLSRRGLITLTEGPPLRWILTPPGRHVLALVEHAGIL